MNLDVESQIKPGSLKELKKFNRMLKIGPKSVVAINKPQLEMVYNVNTAVVSISIGNHTAHLIMTEEAWIDFVEGAQCEILTVREAVKNIKA